MKKIIIRCDSSSSIGVGHLSRMLVLAHQLRNHFSITFAVFPHKGDQSHLIDRTLFSLHFLDSYDEDTFISYALQSSCDLLIIDHYSISFEAEKKLNVFFPVIVMDDLFLDHVASVIINPSFIAKPSDYPHHKGEVITGQNSPLIHPYFFQTKRFIPFVKTNKTPTVLITLGGADVLNLSHTLASIVKNAIPHSKIIIVTTFANPRAKWLKRKYPSTLIGVKQIDPLMRQCDLVITSASTTLSEAIAMKKPFIALQCANNQSPTTHYIQKYLPLLALSNFKRPSIIRALNFLKFQPIHQQNFFASHPFSYGAIGEKIIKKFGEI